MLAERLIGFQSALPTDQGVSWPVCIISTSDGDRPLQTDFSDVRYDFLEYLFVANARIDHGNAFNWNQSLPHHYQTDTLRDLQEFGPRRQVQKGFKGLEAISVERNPIVLCKPQAWRRHVEPR